MSGGEGRRCRQPIFSWLLLLVTAAVVDSWTPKNKLNHAKSTSSFIKHRHFVQNESVEQNVVNVKDASYSMTFPRYRIYLSADKPNDDDGIKKHPLSFLSLSSLFSSAAKTQLEQEFGSSNHVVWLEKKSGLDAFAALWRQSATLYEKATAALVGQDDDSHDRGQDGTRNGVMVVVALPDCSRSIVRHWTEIIDWMKETESMWNDSNNHTMPVFIDAVLLEHKDFPVVKLTARRTSSRYDATSHDDATLFQSQLKLLTKNGMMDPNVIEARMKSWANRILVTEGICPFTKSATKSGQGLSDVGVPVARIVYHTSQASVHQIYQLMAGKKKKIM
jgi:hypothetical protein